MYLLTWVFVVYPFAADFTLQLLRHLELDIVIASFAFR